MDRNELVQLLERNGLKRVEARVLSLFADGRQRTSVEIEREAELRQPEVSYCMARLIQRGWFKPEPMPSPNRGRPYYIYHLTSDYSAVIKDVAYERGLVLAEQMNDLNALRAVA